MESAAAVLSSLVAAWLIERKYRTIAAEIFFVFKGRLEPGIKMFQPPEASLQNLLCCLSSEGQRQWLTLAIAEKQIQLRWAYL